MQEGGNWTTPLTGLRMCGWDALHGFLEIQQDTVDVGLHGMGAGFLIKGRARFVLSGPDFDLMKAKFSWLRAAVAVTVESATQTW